MSKLPKTYKEALELLVKSGRCSAKELGQFSSDELKIIARATLEYLEKGESLTIKRIEDNDYEFEIPSVQAMIEDPHYLGSELGFLEVGRGKKAKVRQFYDFWLERLVEIEEGAFNEICVTGGIGQGKTTFMNVVLIRDFMKLIALKNPQRHYNLMPSTKIVFAFFNITKDLATDSTYTQFQAMLESSPFFNKVMLRNIKLREGFQMQAPPKKGIIFKVGSRVSHALGAAVFGAEMDEANFGMEKFDKKGEERKSQVYDNYTSLLNRKESRFPFTGGHFLLGSSKRSEADFLEKHIESAKDRKGVLVIDQPRYVVKRNVIDEKTGKPLYSGKTFRVLLGDVTREPRVLKDDEPVPPELEHQIENVPIEHKPAFDLNIMEALRDIAGKATQRSQAFITNRTAVRKMIDEKRPAPWKYTTRMATIPNTIVISFYGQDMIQDFLIKENLFSNTGRLPFPDSPRFVGVDTGYSGDALGIAMLCKAGVKIIVRDKQKYFIPRYHVDFVLRIKGGKKEEYPLYKTREFIKHLIKEMRVPIRGFATDGFQSKQMQQELEIAFPGLIVQQISQDITDTYYIDLRNAIYNHSLEGLYADKNLIVELFDLIHIVSGQAGRKGELIKMIVNHPKMASDGFIGRKDVADALSGALAICKKVDTSVSTDEIKESIEEVKKLDFTKIEKEADAAIDAALKEVDKLHLDDLFK